MEPFRQHCKIGTMPSTVVRVHGSDKNKIKPGNWIRVKEREGQRGWTRILIDTVYDHNGFFFASR